MTESRPPARLWSRVAARLRPAPAPRRRPRLTAELLEGRDLMATLYVAPSGADTPGGGRDPGAPLRSLQFAANEAASGDTLRVAGGTYTFTPAAVTPAVGAIGAEQVLTVLDKRLAVYGGYSAADGFTFANPLANPTVIDGGGRVRGIMVIGQTAPAAIDLQGVTVRNGLGGPIPARGGYHATTAFGGGLYIDMLNQPNSTAPIQLRNVTFEGNRAVGGPADPSSEATNFGMNAGGGGIFATHARDLRLENVVFRNNESLGGSGGRVAGRALGGAIHTNYTTVAGTNLLFDGNRAAGGMTAGIGIGGVQEGQFTADATGGAAAFQLFSKVTLSRLTMVNNEVVGGGTTNTSPQAQGGVGYGAALFAELDTSVTVRDARIADNLARGGTGFVAGFASGGGITFENGSLVLDRVAILRNRVVGGERNHPDGRANAITGAGMYVYSVDTGRSRTPVETVAMTNCLVAGNRLELPPYGDVDSGGAAAGIRLNGVRAQIDHTTIADNSFGPFLFFGQALMLQNDGATVPTVVDLRNSIVAGHQPTPPHTSSAVTQFNGTTLRTDNNIFFDNFTHFNTFNIGNPGPLSTTPAVLTGTETTIFADPQFLAPGSDYGLRPGSPAVDQARGGVAPPVDIGNRPRTGARDIGAFELGTSLQNLNAGAATGAATTAGPGPLTGFGPGAPPAATFAAGTGPGQPAAVRSFNPDGSERFRLEPFGNFAGGVRTAEADFNADGVADLVVGTGPGIATAVRVYDGKTQQVLFDTAPFEARFTGGVYVAAGDLTGDGRADLVITPDEGGGPRVRVFGGDGFGQVADFFGIDDPNFRGGARAAVGDIDSDGAGDLVVAAGFLGGPRVAAFSGRSLGSGPLKLFGDFFAFEQTLRNGVFVAVGDLDGDGFAELIAGGGPGGGPRVTAFSGRELLGNQQVPVANFFGGDPENRGGIRLAVKNLDGDNRADLVVGAGTRAGSRVTAYHGKDIPPAGTPGEALAFDAYPGLTNGVFVG